MGMMNPMMMGSMGGMGGYVSLSYHHLISIGISRIFRGGRSDTEDD